jgi:hypothetical protein
MTGQYRGRRRWFVRFGLATCLAAVLVCRPTAGAIGQQPARRFGGTYDELDQRRRHLIDDWIARFVKTTGQAVEPASFYDDIVPLSAKTTFDAVTHALATTRLTAADGAALGDALELVERLEAVRGEVTGARGDRQFRIYARLTPGAFDTLTRSREFERALDNAIYHRGYPINYREQGGVPSIQISVALDRRRADIDVDYRSSRFPAALFNGHLTASNSDVRAGDNYDRHLNRWAGFRNWWRSFFGVRQEVVTASDETAGRPLLPRTPRAGKRTVDVMADDFLTAWLVEGDVAAAMGYVSDRSYACLAQDSDTPADFDRGMAPFQLLLDLKSAHDSLGRRDSLDGLVVGTRLTNPGLRVVRQPYHARFVVYEVRDDLAAAFDCESRLAPGGSTRVRRSYGNYFGTTFYVAGRRDVPVALLWGNDNGYWKIVSWRVGAGDGRATPDAERVVAPDIVRVKADTSFVRAVRGFFESWLVRKDYDAAFEYLSPRSYACYGLEPHDADGAAGSLEDAGRKLRAAIERAGVTVGPQRRLDAVIEAAEPVHAAIRVMDHASSRVFSLSSIPNALAEAAACEARVSGRALPDPLPLEYGRAFGSTVRFKTRAGEAPVLRLVWQREEGVWRITSYGVELP